MNKLSLRSSYKSRVRLTVLVICLTILTIGSATVAYAEEINLALGKPCTLVTGGTLSSSKLEWITDGDLTTMWRSVNNSSPKTHTGIVYCDLGSVMTINRVVVTEYKQKSVNIIIKVSVDGANWTEVGNQSFTAVGSDNRRSEYKFAAQPARYVQVEAPDAVYAFGIYELEVYGSN
jgi:hypothetical protein